HRGCWGRGEEVQSPEVRGPADETRSRLCVLRQLHVLRDDTRAIPMERVARRWWRRLDACRRGAVFFFTHTVLLPVGHDDTAASLCRTLGGRRVTRGKRAFSL